MKKLLTVIILTALAIVLASCSNGTNMINIDSNKEKSNAEITTNAEEKALVVYFSWSGNTKAIATEIANETGADLFEIVPEKAYSTNYNTVVDDAKAQQKENARPKFKGAIKNFDAYTTVYVGFPNWWGDMPMIMYSFFDEYDLSGKTIAPFVSSGGSGFSDTINTMKKLEPKATITDGLSLSSSKSKNPQSDVEKWLSKISK